MLTAVRQFLLIDKFITESPNFILNIKRVLHDGFINHVKLILQ